MIPKIYLIIALTEGLVWDYHLCNIVREYSHAKWPLLIKCLPFFFNIAWIHNCLPFIFENSLFGEKWNHITAYWTSSVVLLCESPLPGTKPHAHEGDSSLIVTHWNSSSKTMCTSPQILSWCILSHFFPESIYSQLPTCLSSEKLHCDFSHGSL